MGGLQTLIFLILAKNSFVSEIMDQVSSTSNFNLRATGSNNKGSISSTSNILLTAKNCNIKIRSTSNAEIEARNTTLNSHSDSNLLLSGNDSKVVLESNSKLKILSDKSVINLFSNSNVNLVAKHSEIQLNSNSDVDISTSESKIVAVNNQHLKIVSNDGGGGRIVTKNTKNHTIKRITGTNLKILVEFSKDDSFFHSIGKHCTRSSTNNPNSANINTYIIYQNDVDIDAQNYKLDNFSFTLEPLSGSLFRIQMLESSDNKIMTGRVLSLFEYELTLTSENELHVLVLHSPSILITKITPPFTFVVDMDGGASSSL